jgi:methanogenic corrinoid protein MtbC1
MNTGIKDEVHAAILAADRTRATEIISEWASQNGFERAVTEILEPTLRSIGSAMDVGGDVSLAHGYLAAKVAEDILTQASQCVQKAGHRAAPGTVVVGNIEDDFHALGRRMVGISLRTAGWIVHDLGNDVLAADFVDSALDVGAKVIGVSAMMHTTALNICKVRQEIDRRGLGGHLMLAVGGAVFQLRPTLIEEVGGDGTARNSLETPRLMADLWRRATAVETVS